MAILHQATLRPSKLELLAAYLPTIPALADAVGDDLRPIGAYRFDDPAGEVGIETHLLTSDRAVTIQVPLTYRAAPLDGADDWFITTMDHSVLGRRWVYHGAGDDVYVAELVRTIATGDTDVELLVDTPDGMVHRAPTVTVAGSGNGATSPPIEHPVAGPMGADITIRFGERAVTVHHLPHQAAPVDHDHLAGTWADLDGELVLARLD